jgi:hypothetical protein
MGCIVLQPHDMVGHIVRHFWRHKAMTGALLNAFTDPLLVVMISVGIAAFICGWVVTTRTLGD